MAVISCLLVIASARCLAGPVAFDHVWIVASPGAPERTLLEAAGFTIAAQRNRHDGQGTSSVTIEFLNGYLELIWVDETVSGSPVVVNKFRQRAQWRTSGWSPIGVGLRRATSSTQALPWPSWQVPRAAWLREGTAIEMLTPRENAEGPSVFVAPDYISVDEGRNRALANGTPKEARDLHHNNGAHRITGLAVVVPAENLLAGLPVDDLRKEAGCSFTAGERYLLEVTLDDQLQKKRRDFRPQLPLVVSY